MSWRVGSKIKLNVYDETGRPVCQCHRELDAALIVHAIQEREDAAIAHQWFAKRFGQVMNGRSFAVKCAMADRMIVDGKSL